LQLGNTFFFWFLPTCDPDSFVAHPPWRGAAPDSSLPWTLAPRPDLANTPGSRSSRPFFTPFGSGFSLSNSLWRSSGPLGSLFFFVRLENFIQRTRRAPFPPFPVFPPACSFSFLLLMARFGTGLYFGFVPFSPARFRVLVYHMFFPPLLAFLFFFFFALFDFFRHGPSFVSLFSKG